MADWGKRDPSWLDAIFDWRALIAEHDNRRHQPAVAARLRGLKNERI